MIKKLRNLQMYEAILSPNIISILGQVFNQHCIIFLKILMI